MHTACRSPWPKARWGANEAAFSSPVKAAASCGLRSSPGSSVGSCKSDLAVPSSTRRHDSAAHVCGASKAAQRTMLRICRLCPSQATGLQGRNPTAYGRVIAMGLCVLEGRAVQVRDRPKAGVTRPQSWTGRYCSTGRSVAPSFFFPFHSRNSVKLQLIRNQHPKSHPVETLEVFLQREKAP